MEKCNALQLPKASTLRIIIVQFYLLRINFDPVKVCIHSIPKESLKQVEETKQANTQDY